MQIFDSYKSNASFDELYDDQQNIKSHWSEIVSKIEEAGLETLFQKQTEIEWHLENNGVTYNIYEDSDKPKNRSWELDPIPFVIAEDEWKRIEKGLEQRAKLFNLIFRDLYSEQRLLKENIIPSELIFSHKGFIREVFDFGYKDEFNINLYAADMARGPDGKMWIVSDKTHAPSGLGYAIENRLTMNTVTKDLYKDMKFKRLSPFLEDLKSVIEKMAGGDLEKAALLTPGPHNETYFEHAYLSSVLGIDIVQGADLLCKNNAVWLKSLSGLKKINTLVKRVDDRYCDPLELDNSSHLGVAGLVGTLREDNLTMMNPIGSGITENIGLNPFMEKICQFFLKEELLLPQIATWWCGQAEALEFVLKYLSTLIIKKVDKTEGTKIYFGKNLSLFELDALKSLIVSNPTQYVAQEEISFSTVPYYNRGEIEPRNAVIRSFCLKSDDGYRVMNGGLVRISENKDQLFVASKSGGISKDLWILGENIEKIKSQNNLIFTQYFDTSIEDISTLKAQNLYWLGRYLSRAIATTRLISHIIKKITNFYRYEIAISKESLMILNKALTHMSMTYPGFLDESKQDSLDMFPMDEIISVIKDTQRSGTLSFTISMLSGTNINLKDILTLESWKLFEKIHQDWYEFSNKKVESTLNVARELDKFLIYFMAYKELVSESIFREQGLILYEIGYKIEDALLLISKTRSLLCLKLDQAVEYEVLEGILSSMASFNAYRAHYKKTLSLQSVVEFLIFNKQFTKSLMYITLSLQEEFKLLPKRKTALAPYESTLVKAQTLLESIEIENLLKSREDEAVYIKLDTALETLSDFFLECSNEFSNTYFSHNDE